MDELISIMDDIFPNTDALRIVIDDVFAGKLVLPPIAKAKVCVPQPAKYILAVFKLFTVVQEVPFQDSVADNIAVFGLVSPPNINPAV